MTDRNVDVAARVLNLTGHRGRIFKVSMTGTPHDAQTAWTRLLGHGPRGAPQASALYLAHNAGGLRRFVKQVREVIDGRAWHATIAGGSASLRITPDHWDEQAQRGSGGFVITFTGRRGGVKWQETYAADRAPELLAALNAAAAHIEPGTREGATDVTEGTVKA